MRARERGGGVGNERKKESKIHLCAWALAVGSRIYNYSVRARERGGGWESEHSLNIHTNIHTNINMNVITGARMMVISFYPCFFFPTWHGRPFAPAASLHQLYTCRVCVCVCVCVCVSLQRHKHTCKDTNTDMCVCVPTCIYVIMRHSLSYKP